MAGERVVSGGPPTVPGMVIDCDSCIARPRACGDCVVTHLLAVRDDPLGRQRSDQSGVSRVNCGTGRGRVSLDDEEVVAVTTMSAAGLVPPLRLVAS